ncbi:MAG: hydroxymethylbilane synthase [Methanomicrobiales archaeon]|nr:hydroxymethylbilane synthase [Methanomicrobiales archaeon]
MHLRIGTRGSKLALAQAETVCRRLTNQGNEVETAIIKTQGDRVTEVPLHEIGGQGIFVRALDDAILHGEIDAAVHSMKDIPAKRPPELPICAILPRDSPADFLIFEGDIGHVQTIGTSSMRRQSQLLRHDPAVTIKPLRGNLDTRIRRLVAGDFDAIVVAEAGIQRLGYQVSGVKLPPQRFIPTANQGTVAVVCRNDPALIETFRPLDHPTTRNDVLMERAAMEEIGGGCFTPLGIYCEHSYLMIEALSLDGSRWKRLEGDVQSEPEARDLGRRLKEQAADLIAEAQARVGDATEG